MTLRRFVLLLAVVICASFVPHSRADTAILRVVPVRITPIPIAKVEVMKTAKTVREADLFAGPGENTAKRKTLVSKTVVYLTGTERGGWVEVWAEEVGISWISKSNIEILGAEPK